MKYNRFILALFTFLLFMFSLRLSAQSCSEIYVYRPNILGNSLALLSVYIDDVEVGVIKNNSALKILVSEKKKYDISARWNMRGEDYRSRTTKEIEIDCGKSSYIEVKSVSLIASNLLIEDYYNKGETDMAGIPFENIEEVNIQDFLTSTVTETNEPENEEKESVALPIDVVRKQDELPPQHTENTSVSTKTTESNGNSYALIIGINEYMDASMNDLDQPVSDASKLVDVLLRKYTFQKEDVLFLKNPTKDEITEALDDYFEQLTSNDNLLIFYAGHGYWDEKFKQGYWLAADANRENRGTWLSNGTIRDYIRAIPSNHTLLVTDACFGGGIFKSRSAFSNSSMAINQLYKLPSRKAMTSGAMSEVPDKSVFLQYLVKRLEHNTEKYLSSEQLFASFKIAVINNSSNGQVPQFGEIKETGDEGGDYIFIKK